MLKTQSILLKKILSSHFLFLKYLNALDLTQQKKINGFELYFQKLIIDKSIKPQDYIDREFFKALHRPHSSLDEENKALVWKLLVKIAPIDPVHLFWYDKAEFYKNYKLWSPTYKDWVIDCILENNKKHDL